ncbi:RNA polymerase I-specific transcription initiation factor RRN3 [Thalassophryne amazonica]|uniref:RNA polymerase I-specific transcription initiation factor RRN3 n=1 Tax=Thalassophryne amazonica TaxID=390379 RepID=UPI0014721E70|nr:RNA polymerase I-specific transcription initiation factor RRN3 [Thalassophryne amazonica]
MKAAQYRLEKAIRAAKRQHREKTEDFYSNTDPRRMWRCLDHFTDFRTSSRNTTISSLDSLPDDLNAFYTRFESPTPTTSTEYRHAPATQRPPPPPVVTSAQVHKAVRSVHPQKAAGPDNVPGHALRVCANKLADVLTSIFNLSLRQCIILRCYKTTTPSPKRTPSCLNDFRPVALTSIIMKCFERVILSHIHNSIPDTTDPLQYTYRHNRSTSDTIATALHISLSHLENKDSYIRMLFIDYSSTFNMVAPHKLTHKLLALGLHPSLCDWLLNFLTGRPQSVRIGRRTSATITTNMGTPQGCVLSPILYTLFTHDCVASHPNNTIIKLADNNAVIGHITGGDEAAYRREVDSLEVERVRNFKYLGVHISDDLSWIFNTTQVVKKAQQQLYCLRRLRKSGTAPKILSNFYSCIIELVLTTCITVWYGSSTVWESKRLQRGDSTDYELLKHQLADTDIKDAQIISWLQEFRSCVTQLNKDHEQLIQAVLRLPWVGRSPAVVEEYLAFLGNLVSAQTVFLCTCLKMVVSHFIPKRVTVSEGGVNISDSDDEDDNLSRNFDRCHQALQVINRYVPSTGYFLVPVLRDNFPFVQKSPRTLECYVHNLFRVTVYIPSIQRDVLEVVMAKLLKLDVSAPRSDIEVSEGNAMPQTEDGLFEMVRNIFHLNGVLHVERTKELYWNLLSVFDKLILPTHDCCHVQYSLFYLCSLRLALAEAFLDHLWKILQSPAQPAVLRQAAAGYFGSFLARAKFIPVPTVRACLDLLIHWIHAYLDSQDVSGKQACCDISLHGPFYATCQAAFYTLIFRHRAILQADMKTGLEYLRSLNLERVVMSQLNPLKVCLPSVTSMFAAITRKYQVVFCYTVIERNKSHVLPVLRTSAGGERVTTNTNPLDSFFPFDPYLLTRTAHMIAPLYQVWEEPADTELPPAGQLGPREDEDDFLPQTEGIMGVMPSPCETSIHSPCSVGSPPQTFHSFSPLCLTAAKSSSKGRQTDFGPT